MFASCCVDGPPTDIATDDKILAAEPKPFGTESIIEEIKFGTEPIIEEIKPAEAVPEPLVTDVVEAVKQEPEQPSTAQQTIEQTVVEVVEVVADTPALKEEPLSSVVVINEPAVKAELANVSSTLSTVEVNLQPGPLGVKFDGVMVVEVTPDGQAFNAGVGNGYKVVMFGGESVPADATTAKLMDWLQEKLRSPRPVLVQFERQVLQASISDGTLGLTFKGRTVIKVIPGLWAANAGVKPGCILLSFGSEVVPPGYTNEQLAEWLQQRFKAPRPVVLQFAQP